ncbi:MAG TPA: CARDB domain-containing protein, partial [bacterium]
VLSAGVCLAANGKAADTVEVQKIVLAERDLKIGQDQLVQVSLRNTTPRATQAGVRIELRDEKDARVGQAQQRKVSLAPLDESREFFTFNVPRRQGKFTVRMELFTPDFAAHLLGGDPVFYSPFTVLGGPEAPPEKPRDPNTAASVEGGDKAGVMRGPPSFNPPTGLKFERADLLWENVTVKPQSLLVGDSLHITADLRNVGGDIARNVDVVVEYFNVRNPARRIPISKSAVLVVAPGDKVEMEFDTVFNEDTALGDYKVMLSIDPGNRLDESNKENNATVLEAPIRVSVIKQVFPEPNFVFEDAGLFLFRWDTKRFDEFKVQVGTDPDFSNPANFFDMPQGDKWTKATEVVPLEGELPDMALGLMQRQKVDRLYWRVTARNTQTGKTGVSQATPFRISLPPGTVKPQTQPQAFQPGLGMPGGRTAQSDGGGQPFGANLSFGAAPSFGSAQSSIASQPATTAQAQGTQPQATQLQPAQPAQPGLGMPGARMMLAPKPSAGPTERR